MAPSSRRELSTPFMLPNCDLVIQYDVMIQKKDEMNFRNLLRMAERLAFTEILPNLQPEARADARHRPPGN